MRGTFLTIRYFVQPESKVGSGQEIYELLARPGWGKEYQIGLGLADWLLDVNHARLLGRCDVPSFQNAIPINLNGYRCS